MAPKACHAACPPANLPLFSRRIQLPVPLGVDLLLTSGQHFLRRDVANRAVQPNVVVAMDVALHQTPRIFQRQGRSWPDTLSVKRLVPAFDFSVRLRIVRRSSDMRYARDPNELLGNDPGRLSEMIRGRASG